MALDGVVLNAIVRTLKLECPLKINRITQASDYEFLFQVFNGKKFNLLISTHPTFARLQLSDIKSSTNLDQTHFLMLLRKHLGTGIIKSIEQYGFDRVVVLTIEHRDDMGVIRNNKLILELIGRSPNLILVNESGVTLDAQRRLAHFESNERSIYSGSVYQFPKSFDKQSFDKIETYHQDTFLRNQFDGISPILEREINHRLKTSSMHEIKNEILQSSTLYVYDKDYHIIELTHLQQSAKVLPLFEGMDYFYFEKQAQDRIKSHTGDLLKLIRRELKKSESKLPKLQDDLKNAIDCEDLREYGDLLFAFAHDKQAGQKEFNTLDFEGNPVTIPLDPRFNGKDNAKRYFKRYNKAKTSIRYLEDQIENTQDRIAYFSLLKMQCEQADVEDAKEIAEELMNQGIINQKKVRKTQHKKTKNNYITIPFDEETTIYVGKNNLQNDTISFKLARKEDYWFHAANMAGAHVLIKTPELNEEKQRLCCQLAAYFSAGRHSSSVEVHYTHAKNIKKVSKGALGLVQLSTHKSMFIDPDEDYLMTYLKQ